MTPYFAPLRAKSAEPLALDMQSLFLSGRVLPFGAKLSVTHVFRSSEKSPAEVVYCFPLPRDASLISFQISGENFSISSRLERTSDAQKRYERALEAGSLAALTQQNLDGLVNLTVGNLRPGETVSVRLELVAGVSLSDSGFRLRFPFTVAPCYHSEMRVSVDGPGTGTIELPDHVAGGVFLPPFHADTSGLHSIGFELQVEPADGVGEIASPSHAVRLLLNSRDTIGVKLSPDRDVPNRDLALDVKCDLGAGRAWSDRPHGDRKHFAVVVPSTAFGQQTKVARRLAFLLDRSGSMGGVPIRQARHALENCLANLTAEDHFGIVAFDSTVERFHPTMLSATRENVEKACVFLNKIDARGGTELASGVEAAAQLLAGCRGEIFVITDGQVFDTSQIVQRARKCEVRLFCLGIGSATQDRFLELLARQTGGICRFVAPSERVDAAAFEVFAAIGGTVAAEVHVANVNAESPSAESVFCGTPFVAFGDIDISAGTIVLKWPQAERGLPIEVLSEEWNGFIKNLHGAKRIADFEAGYNRSDTAARQRLLELSERYGVTSSEMSLVAVVERNDDQGGDVPKTKIVPVGMAQDVEFDSYFAAGEPPVPMLADLDISPKQRIYSQASRSGIFARRARLHASSRPSPERGDLLPLMCEAVRIVEDYALTKPSGEVSAYISTLLSVLRSEQNRIADKTRSRALKALIEYLASDLNASRWAGVCRQLEHAWPELKKNEQSGPQQRSNRRITVGMRRDKALEVFEKGVNQPGTMFSTDHWLQPKLEQLRTLLSDPITDEQAMALVDVLYERHRMADLLEWLQGPPLPWQSFVALRDFVDAIAKPVVSSSIRAGAKAQRWLKP